MLGGRSRGGRLVKRNRGPRCANQIDPGKQEERHWHDGGDDEARQKHGKRDAAPDRGTDVREEVVPCADDVVRTDDHCQTAYYTYPTIIDRRKPERRKDESRHEK